MQTVVFVVWDLWLLTINWMHLTEKNLHFVYIQGHIGMKHNQLFRRKSCLVDLTYNQVSTSKYTVVQCVTDIAVNQSYTKRHSRMRYTVSSDVTGCIC